MSDYLGHLLERSFTPARQVRPQVPAIFEPAPVANVVASPAINEVANEIFVAAPNSASNLETREINSPLTEPPATVIPQKAQWPLRYSEKELPIPTRAVEASARSSPDNFPLAAASPFQPRPRTEPVFPSTVVSTKKIPDVEKKTATEKKTELVHSPEELSASPMVRASAEKVFLQKTYLDATTVIRPIAAISPVRAAVANNNSSLAGKESRRPLPAANHAPAPDINITIGRIEVRATSPPAALKAKGKKATGMSLETYLERRTEGGRR